MKQVFTIAIISILSVSAHKLDAKPKIVYSDTEKALHKFHFRQEDVKDKLEDCIKEIKPKEGVSNDSQCKPERG